MKFTTLYSKIFKKVFPSPFTIAILLTAVVFLLALLFTAPKTENHLSELMLYWRDGLWSKAGFEFTVQMMLMLILGHAIALSAPIQALIQYVLQFCQSNTKAVVITITLTLLVSYINWGLGLIFGAIMARQVGEYAARNNIAINYALVGASGYIGLMVWHGGLSGSAPLKASEPNALLEMTGNSNLPTLLSEVDVAYTLGSTMNITSALLVFALLPLLGWWLAMKSKTNNVPTQLIRNTPEPDTSEPTEGVERLDKSRLFSIVLGFIFLCLILLDATEKFALDESLITPNFVNLCLLSLALLLHKNLSNFIQACEEAMRGAAGILIQFPLYFGIMEIMRQSGLLSEIAGFFVRHSSENTFPLFTFFSAGLINLFVPSGGGQWSVQGPIIVETCLQQGWNLPKSIMALAYGDQLTNMLQPFWALPLLGITGLKAQQILPYTLVFLVVGIVIFGGVLLVM